MNNAACGWWGHRGKAGTTLEMASPPGSGSGPHREEHSCGQLDAEVPGDPLVVPGSALWVQGKPSAGLLCGAGPRPARPGKSSWGCSPPGGAGSHTSTLQQKEGPRGHYLLSSGHCGAFC